MDSFKKNIQQKYQSFTMSWCKSKKNVNDPRSYRQNSDKLLKTGFRPLFSVEDAIIEIKERLQNKKILINDKCHTVKWMKKRSIK